MTKRRAEGFGPVAPSQPQRMKQPGFWEAWKEAPYSIRYAKPYRKAWFAAVGLMALSAGLALLAPWPLAFLIDGVLQHKSSVPGPIARLFGSGPINLIAFAAVATLLITGLLQGASLLYEYITTKMDQHMTLDFRSDLFEHAQRLSLTYHDQTKTGKFIYTINSMATSAGNIVMAAPPMAQALFTLVGMFWITARIDPALALLSMSITPLIYYALGHYNRRVLPAVREVAGREMEALSVVHEAMTMLRLVVAFGRERYEHRRYRTQAEHVVRARVQVTVRQTLFSFAVEILTAAGTALVMGFGAYRVLKGHMTVGDLTVVLAYVASIYSPVQQISGTLGHLQIDLYHLHRCKSIMDTPPEVTEAAQPVDVERTSGDIRYEHVDFAYQGRDATLSDIDVHIPAGQRLAVLGPTGAGKTTLVSLLVRYHDPKQGRILLDGRDIRELSLKSLRNQMAVVQQEPILFSGTIADNIRYGRLDASMRDLVEAAKAANAHDFIMRLPRQYEAMLGERGAQLSGGERQRISIARAFVRDAPILILDEPTSSVDSKTEAVILDALERLMRGRTTILIAHRLSTIRSAESVLVLDEGRVVEHGTQEDLRSQGGLFSEIWSAQLGSSARVPAFVPEGTAKAGMSDLARALAATSDSERQAAREALTRIDRAELIAWAREAVRSGSAVEAGLAARVAEGVGLSDLAVDLVERAAALPADARAPLVSAFRSFAFDPGSLEPTLLAIDPARRSSAAELLLEMLGPEVETELQRLADNGPAGTRDVARDALRRAEGDESPRAHGIESRPAEGPRLVGPPRIVVFGMITKMPVAGVVWQTIQYLIGFRELGYAVTYIEAHGRTPSMFMDETENDGWARAASFLAGVMERFGFANDWAYQASDAGRHFGLGEAEVRRRCATADLLINLHGGMVPLPDHVATGRLIYLETDPVEVQVQLAVGRPETIEYLEAHAAHFTFGENIGRPDCGVPVSDRIHFLPTRQPVVMDLWRRSWSRDGVALTTIGNWEQPWGQVNLRGEVYTWSKHHEFLKFLDLPSRTQQPLELALSRSSIGGEHRELLEQNGWRYRDALEFSLDLDAYRDYIRSSRGEFTVAKDQNVRLRSGWFSDRSATYLATGRPVITQETGFSNVLPTGEGLFAFETVDDVVGSIDRMNSDYERHARAAREVAQECFAHDVVLGRLLHECGARAPQRRASPGPPRDPIPGNLRLEPISRRPLVLAPATDRYLERMPTPAASRMDRETGPTDDKPMASIVVVSFDGLRLTKLCIASILANTVIPYELIVVDNGSTDGSLGYLEELERTHGQVRVVRNAENRGFAAAVNQGVAMARGDTVVVLNNDTVLAPGWLGGLIRHLEAPGVGLVGAVTNRSGTEAEVEAACSTYADLMQAAQERSRDLAGRCFDIGTAAMFCVAFRRATFDEVGPVDEAYGLGLFEDDDYSMRMRASGRRVVCAEDVLVYHFGEASFGKLVPTGEHGELFRTNRGRFEQRWGSWDGNRRRPDASYQDLLRRVRAVVSDHVPRQATVLVISRGDDAMLELDGRTAWHFPNVDDNVYSGHHPATGHEAVAGLEELRIRGAEYLVVPATAAWWLEHYPELAGYLGRHRRVAHVPGTCSVYALNPADGDGAAAQPADVTAGGSR
jgi:ATP-binding cassette, subfamily B, bacterial